ncbi:MAG: Rid family detoxifying hydrolase [Methanoregula sp.]
MADSGKIILVLVFVCGLLAGIILSGLLFLQTVDHGKHVIYSRNAPEPIGPYSQAVSSGNLVFLSGQIGIDPVTGNLTSNVSGQTTRVMENLRAVLENSGLGFEDVVQARIYLVNMSDWNTVNGIYGSYFNSSHPARAAVHVAGLPRGAAVEIEMVAQKR